MMPSRHIKTLLKLTIYIISILLIWYLTPRLIRFFIPFVIGWIIAMIANPIVKFFESKFKVMRKHGTWLVIVGVLGVVVLSVYLIGVWLAKEAVAFSSSIPDMYSSFLVGLETILDNLAIMFPNLSTIKADLFMNVESYLGDLVGKVGSPALGVVGDIAKNIPNLLVMIIFMFLSAYFFIADKEIISDGFRKAIPITVIEKWNWLKKMFSKAVGGYFIAQFKIMGVIAIILWIGLMILNVNYAVLWAILIAFLDFLPFFGTGFVIWPWSVYELLTGDFAMVAGLMGIYLVCLLVHQLLQPKFVGNTVGMDSFTTLICMFIGYRISSVIGMIIAVPIGIIILNLYKEGAFDVLINDIQAMFHDFSVYLKKRD